MLLTPVATVVVSLCKSQGRQCENGVVEFFTNSFLVYHKNIYPRTTSQRHS